MVSPRLFPFFLIVAALVFSLRPLPNAGDATAAEPNSSEAIRLFEERIMPIFRSPKPSSCVQCHLASVDIKDYILPSHIDTFLALRDQGLINLEDPPQSKILTLIRMGERDLDAGARLIHEKTRAAEYEAFSTWIEACCQDESLVKRSANLDVTKVGPSKPLEVVRHARKSRLVESFTHKIWSQRMRCFPCHTPNEIDPDNPKHKVPSQRHAELVAKYGAKMDIFQKTPEETLARLIAGSQKTKAGRYPMINLVDPSKSLLVLKPTAKLPDKLADGSLDKPSSSDPVSHMGGLKMHVHDQSYKAFVSWIEDYAAVVGDRYLEVEDLPNDQWIPTDRILRMADVPEQWGQASTVQLFVHATEKASDQWSPDPVAFVQGTVTPRRFVNGPLFLIASRQDGPVDQATGAAFPLKPGKYLIKVYVDANDKVATSPSLLLDQSDFIGQVVINAAWQVGFPNAETFSAMTIERASR